MGKEPKEPFQAPDVKEDRKKRKKKVKKERLHIYITQDCIEKVDERAAELDLDRSPCIQMLLNVGLSHLKSNGADVFTKRTKKKVIKSKK